MVRMDCWWTMTRLRSSLPFAGWWTIRKKPDKSAKRGVVPLWNGSPWTAWWQALWKPIGAYSHDRYGRPPERRLRAGLPAPQPKAKLGDPVIEALLAFVFGLLIGSF